MKTGMTGTFFTGLTVGVLLGIAGAIIFAIAFRSSVARYRVVEASDTPFLIDDQTGQSWRWSHYNDINSDVWIPIARFQSEDELVRWARVKVNQTPKRAT